VCVCVRACKHLFTVQFVTCLLHVRQGFPFGCVDVLGFLLLSLFSCVCLYSYFHLFVMKCAIQIKTATAMIDIGLVFVH